MIRGAAIALLALTAAGCASTPEPAIETPPPPARPVTPAPEPEPPPQPADRAPAPPPAEAPRVGAYGPKMVEIGPANIEGEEPQSLSEAAAAERERRRSASLPIAVITDDTLSEYAVGELTIGGAPELPPLPEGAVAPGGAAEDAEAYWRGRLLEARQAWRRAADEIERLESEVAELRQRFYAEDDPFYRDSTIKPAWDRALDRLADARRDLAESRQQVADLMDEGRRVGALPGWLREGIELEPGDPEREEMPEHQTREPSTEHRSMEPVTVDPDDGGER